MLPAPTPLVVGRGTDGFPEGCPDMTMGSKDDWRSSRRYYFRDKSSERGLELPKLRYGTVR